MVHYPHGPDSLTTNFGEHSNEHFRSNVPKLVMSRSCLASLLVRSTEEERTTPFPPLAKKNYMIPSKQQTCVVLHYRHWNLSSSIYRDAPPNDIIGLATFVHAPDADNVDPLQLICVPGVICALRKE
jgi:hypothetical protein